MSGRYWLSSPAEQDVAGIVEYLAAHSLDASLKWIDRLTVIFELLAAQPNMGERYVSSRRVLRRTSLGDYLIFYQPCDDGVRIVRVLHGAQNWHDLL